MCAIQFLLSFIWKMRSIIIDYWHIYWLKSSTSMKYFCYIKCTLALRFADAACIWFLFMADVYSAIAYTSVLCYRWLSFCIVHEYQTVLYFSTLTYCELEEMAGLCIDWYISFFFGCSCLEMIMSAKKAEVEPMLYDHRPYQLSEDTCLRVCQIPHRKVW